MCGIDLAKNVFEFYGVDESNNVTKKRLKRKEVSAFFARLSPCLVGMQACGGSHYWARELIKLGHTVRLMSPQFVKPYVKGNKTDANDAEGIHEVLLRPTMRFVAVKTVGQQDILMLHRIRSGYIKSRTAQANRIRGLLAEYGIVIPRRLDQLRKGVVDVTAADDRLTPLAREHIYGLYEDLLNTDDQMSRIEKAIMQVFKTSEPCQRLQSIPGIGPLTATALVASIGNISCFKNGRELSAWLGIVCMHSLPTTTMSVDSLLQIRVGPYMRPPHQKCLNQRPKGARGIYTF